MKLTFLTHSPDPGGSTSLLMQLREFFDLRGHATTVVVGSEGNNPAFAQYLVVPPPKKQKWRDRIAQYRATVEKTEPDIVYSISGKDEFDVLRFLPKARIRHISSLESNPYTNIRFWLEQLSGFTEAITANTPDVLDQIRAFNVGMKHGIVAPYRIAPEYLAVPVSTPRLMASHPSTNLEKQTVNICYVGRLEPFLKRAHWLSMIARCLENCDPPIRWHIYGNGPCEDKLHHDLQSFESNGSVIFHGWKDKKDLARELPAHDIFFLCSRSEGLPVAMVEAMLCGLACVAPAYPAGITYVLEKGGGWLYEAKSPEKCALILRAAISDRTLLERKKGEAQRIASSLFSSSAVESDLNKLESVVSSLSFNGNCLDLEQASRMMAVHPWVSLKRRMMKMIGFAPERF